MEFVRRSREQSEAGSWNDKKERIAFHEVGATIVSVRGDRALADTLCILHSFFPIDGVACKMTGFVRLLWRLQKTNEHWLIAGVRCIYIRDFLTPCNPSHVPHLDDAELATYRPSYRYLTSNLVRAGLVPADDLPGEDRPEMVETLRGNDEAWLERNDGEQFATGPKRNPNATGTEGDQ